MSNVDKSKEMLDSWCEASGIEFISKEAEEAYKKRARRFADVIQLKVVGSWWTAGSGLTRRNTKMLKRWWTLLNRMEYTDKVQGARYKVQGKTEDK